MTTSADQFMDNEPPDEEEPPGLAGPETFALVQRIKEVVWAANQSAERSQQKAAGPSEIGQECTRRLAYKSIGFTPVNFEKDSWPAIVGTAVHAWLADAFEQADRGSGRYLVEFRAYVTLPSGMVVPGHLDVYDRVHHELTDHKVVGSKSAAKYRRSGSPIGYRVQGDIYGRMLEESGETPLRVGQMYYPREGSIDNGFGYSEPYNRARAEDALSRYEAIKTRAEEITQGGRNPAALTAAPKVPSPLCGWCPYHMPNSPSVGVGCPGKGGDPQ